MQAMRKTVGASSHSPSPEPARAVDELDVADAAHVFITSEEDGHPIENAFDLSRGPGGTQWVASTHGPQTLTLAFDVRQSIRAVTLEVEETAATRTQELELSRSRDGGAKFETVLRQEFTFSPAGATFERERWALDGSAVTHLRLVIRPDKGGGGRDDGHRARLTSLVVEASPASA
jgi:hypothetical protein